MSLVAIATSIAVVALVIWAFGSVLARFGGALIAATGLVSTVAGHSLIAGLGLAALGLAALGLALWFAGHIAIGYKSGQWRSRLARRLCSDAPQRMRAAARRRDRPPRSADTSNRISRLRRPSVGQHSPSVHNRHARAAFEQWERELAE